MNLAKLKVGQTVIVKVKWWKHQPAVAYFVKITNITARNVFGSYRLLNGIGSHENGGFPTNISTFISTKKRL